MQDFYYFEEKEIIVVSYWLWSEVSFKKLDLIFKEIGYGLKIVIKKNSLRYLYINCVCLPMAILFPIV